MSSEYQEISEARRESYKLQLRRDSEKDFNGEFVRTTDLERKIIDEHGFEGVRLVFEARGGAGYFRAGEFPADCPWAGLNGLSPAEFIEADFKAIEDKIPNLLDAMKDRCRFVYAERDEAAWKLHYFLDAELYDGRKYFTVYTGGAPNANPLPNESLLQFGWAAVPQDLAEFYRIHDGFGEVRGNCVLKNSEISVMAETMNPICEENDFERPPEYDFEDLLEFFPDGGGNAQCFHRKNSDSANALTVDWDHETWEITDESGFYDFIDRQMSELDEE